MIETGEAMKQIADIKYALDDNMKQNFLEPLHHLQSKDLKEVMVSGGRARPGQSGLIPSWSKSVGHARTPRAIIP